MYNNKLKSIIYGLAIGNSLGVFFHLKSKEQTNYCKKVEKCNAYNIPKGTWADATSLTLCLLDTINYPLHQIDLNQVKQNFIDWLNNSAFTATGICLDIDNKTKNTIKNMSVSPNFIKCGDENSQDNGSLMRISPLIPFLTDCDIEMRFEYCEIVSSITHANPISIVGCHIYMEYMIELYKNPIADKQQSLFNIIEKLTNFYEKKESKFYNAYCEYHHIINGDILEKDICITNANSVIETLKIVIYCFLHSESYRSSILSAINLGGENADTIAAITGSIAGLYFGMNDIPKKWINELQNKTLIDDIILKSISS